MKNEKLVMTVYNYYMEIKNKSKVASFYNISPRTVGRYIDEAEKLIEKGYPRFDEIEEEFEEDIDNSSIYVYLTDSSINFMKVDQNETKSFTLSNDHSKFSEIFEMIKSDYSQENLKNAYVLADKKEFIIEKSKKTILKNVTIDPEENKVYFDFGADRKFIDGKLCDRLIEKLKNGEDLDGIINFTINLLDNPSDESIKDLYGFLEHNDIEIDSSGYVIAYKKITIDYKDVHTKKISNHVGAIVKMPRSMVDSDRNATCSSGLHVCAKSYLEHFFGDIIIKCKIHPMDFVSVPTDYNNAKARVCEYIVIEECTNDFV